MDLTGVGIWSGELRYGEGGEVRAAAAELESLGYSALWIPDAGGEVFGALRALLDSTTTIVAATGVLNLWMHPAEEVGAGFAALRPIIPTARCSALVSATRWSSSRPTRVSTRSRCRSPVGISTTSTRPSLLCPVLARARSDRTEDVGTGRVTPWVARTCIL